MPGWFANHLRRSNTFHLDNLNYLVINEADRKLDGNFDEDLKYIDSHLPRERIKLLFSPTIGPSIKRNILFSIIFNVQV